MWCFLLMSSLTFALLIIGAGASAATARPLASAINKNEPQWLVIFWNMFVMPVIKHAHDLTRVKGNKVLAPWGEEKRAVSHCLRAISRRAEAIELVAGDVGGHGCREVGREDAGCQLLANLGRGDREVEARQFVDADAGGDRNG